MVIAAPPWSRVYVVIVPILLYAVWYAGWGHMAESHLSLRNVVHSPIYLLKGLAASASSLLGVPNSVRAAAAEGRLPLVPLIVVSADPARRGSTAPQALADASSRPVLEFPGGPPLILVARGSEQCARTVAMGVAVSVCRRSPAPHGPRESREWDPAARGRRVRRPWRRRLGGDCQPQGPPTITTRPSSDLATRARGALAAFEVGGASADPNFITGPGNTDIISLNSLRGRSLPVGRRCVRLTGVRRFGARASRPEEARVAADQLLAKAEELRPVPVAHAPPPGGAATSGIRWDRRRPPLRREAASPPPAAAVPPPRSTCLAPG